MAKKKKSGLILKGGKNRRTNSRLETAANTNTNTKTIPSSLKPQRARHLIRRFHTLQKNKHAIIVQLKQKLNLQDRQDPQEANRDGDFVALLEKHQARLYQLYSIVKETNKGDDTYKDDETYTEDKTSTEDKFHHNSKSTTSSTPSTSLSTPELVRQLAAIDAEIELRGGLQTYQIASTQGQSGKRGGDSSKKLIEWLKSKDKPYYKLIEQHLHQHLQHQHLQQHLQQDIVQDIEQDIEQDIQQNLGQTPENHSDKNSDKNLDELPTKKPNQPPHKKLPGLSALEIGCLSPYNMISTSHIFAHVTRIDLNSQHKLIVQQDFMSRPLPVSNEEKFNLISCSLVLNFVPTPQGRGEMLCRITEFLKPPSNQGDHQGNHQGNHQGDLSALFLVLPSPCVNNSRYFNKSILNHIMTCLGFQLGCFYETSKLAYWLFDWTGAKQPTGQVRKQEISPGPAKNNFCVTLDLDT